MIALSLPAGPLRVLCLGAHPDDIEIGCGATLLTLAGREGTTAHHVVLTGVPNRRDEARAAAAAFWGDAVQPAVTMLDLPDGRLPEVWGAVKEALEGVAGTFQPDLVLAPSTADSHQDHRLLGELVGTVWRDSLVLHYEIPKWDGDLGPVTHYVPATEAVARRKVELLNRCYPSQTGRDWWTDETFLGLLRLRGIECRARYAEGFRSPKTLIG
jgi:LmbE family N-acetylglucosaminyl deacetylase